MIGTGMSVVRDAFSGLSLFISSKVCSNEKNKIKLNFGLLLEILSLIHIILGWSLYFLIETFTISARKFEGWSSEKQSFGTDSFFSNITEILLESIGN